MPLPAVLALALTPPPAVLAPPPPARSAPARGPGRGPLVRTYADVALSPDATQVAAVESGGAGAAAGAAVVVRSARDGAVLRRYDPCAGACGYAGLSWAPDSTRLAFVQSRQGFAAVLYAAKPAAGGGASVLSTLNGLLQAPRWSPDGRTLAALAVKDPHKQTGATQAGAARVGEFLDSAVDEQRIAVVPATGGELKLVTPPDTFVYEYDWTPDGRGFVATAVKGDGDDNWWVAKLEAFGLDGGERVIAAPKVQMDFPRVSADGSTVAFIGGLMSDVGSVGGDVYAVPVAGGEPRDLTPGFKGTFTSLAWRGGAIQALALTGAQNAAVRIDPAGGPTVLDSIPMSFSAADGDRSLSADGTVAAAVVQDFEHAPAIYVHGPAGPVRITHENDALPAAVSARSIAWRHDGQDVQGWLLGPRAPVPGRRYPMIVEVHGGPAAAATPRYVAEGMVKDLVDRGYFVLEPNPRGSYGQGEAFVRLNRRDFGGADLGDILAGVDAAEKAAPIDDARLGLYGHSYGGFMTMWGVTHTDRFKAAVAGAGIADWVSYTGENGIDQWMLPYFGASAYDDPAIYDKLSPIRYIHAAKTPTFIYVGERDIECPPDQSIQFWHGLKAMGVATSLVVYEGEGHGIRNPAHQRDLHDRILAWFGARLHPEGAQAGSGNAATPPAWLRSATLEA